MAHGRYRPRPALKLLRRLMAFAAGAKDDPVALVTSADYVKPLGVSVTVVRPLTADQIEGARGQLRYVLQILSGYSRGIPGTFHQLGHLACSVRLTAWEGPRWTMDVGANLADALKFMVYSALLVVGMNRLRSCPAPDCGRLFVKVGRREYCSARCQHRHYYVKPKPRKDRHGQATRQKRRQHSTAHRRAVGGPRRSRSR